MKLRSLKLFLGNIARTTNSKSLPVNSIGNIYETDENGNRSDTIVGYTINCATNKGDEIKIKFPMSVEEKITDLKRQLENDVEIEISFTNLKLTPYALKTKSGDVISGVSGKADDFNIFSTKMDDVGFDISEDVEV